MKQKTNVTPLQKIETSKEKDDRSVVSSLSPREIVSELDRYVIGQHAAKRAVAIALRNRWRRQALKGDMKDEVLPKNILMIGPTGVGKTEISRRLSKLAEAPFIKVEATRFTEVGYVGRDVEQIIRDLLEIAISIRLPTPFSSIDWNGLVSRISFSMYSGRNLLSASSLLKLNTACVRSFVPKLKNSAVFANSFDVKHARTTSSIVPKFISSLTLYFFSISDLITS